MLRLCGVLLWLLLLLLLLIPSLDKFIMPRHMVRVLSLSLLLDE